MENNNQQTNPIAPTSEELLDKIKSENAKKQTRGSNGKFVPNVEATNIPPISVTTNGTQYVSTSNPPDLLNVKVTNPLVYIKYWWKRIMANEGLEAKVKVKPITAIAIAVALFSLAFGLGGVVFPFAFPWLKIKSQVVNSTQTPTPSEWKETAIKGTLKKTTVEPTKFFLLISSDEAVTLQVPQGINLTTLIGRRILATGNYNQKQKLLIVSDVQDLEVLSTTPIPIPTNSPSPRPTESPTPTAMPTIEPTVIPTETPTL
jgi:hypothetical protein